MKDHLSHILLWLSPSPVATLTSFQAVPPPGKTGMGTSKLHLCFSSVPSRSVLLPPRDTCGGSLSPSPTSPLLQTSVTDAQGRGPSTRCIQEDEGSDVQAIKYAEMRNMCKASQLLVAFLLRTRTSLTSQGISIFQPGM